MYPTVANRSLPSYIDWVPFRAKLERRISWLAQPEAPRELLGGLGDQSALDVDTFWFLRGILDDDKVAAWRDAEEKLFMYRLSRQPPEALQRITEGLWLWRKFKGVPLEDVPDILYRPSEFSYVYQDQCRHTRRTTEGCFVTNGKVFLYFDYLVVSEEESKEVAVAEGLSVDHALLLHRFRKKTLFPAPEDLDRYRSACPLLPQDEVDELRHLLLEALFPSIEVVPPCVHRIRYKQVELKQQLTNLEKQALDLKVNCWSMREANLCPFSLGILPQMDIEDMAVLLRGETRRIPPDLLQKARRVWLSESTFPNKRCAVLNQVVKYPERTTTMFTKSPMEWC